GHNAVLISERRYLLLRIDPSCGLPGRWTASRHRQRLRTRTRGDLNAPLCRHIATPPRADRSMRSPRLCAGWRVARPQPAGDDNLPQRLWAGDLRSAAGVVQGWPAAGLGDGWNRGIAKLRRAP